MCYILEPPKQSKPLIPFMLAYSYHFRNNLTRHYQYDTQLIAL